MNVILKKLGENIAALGNGSSNVAGSPGWIPSIYNGKRRVIVRCTCGAFTHMRKHHIHPNGTLTPSLHHNGPVPSNNPEKCGWHVNASLRDWDGGDSPPLEE